MSCPDVQNLISEDKSTKKLWNYIKSQRKEETGIADLTENNKHISNAKEKADLFNKQFSNVFSSPCDKEYPPAQPLLSCLILKPYFLLFLLFFIIKMSSVYLQGLGRWGTHPLPSQDGNKCLSGSSLTKAAICFTYVCYFYIWVKYGLYYISWHLFDTYRCLCVFNVFCVFKKQKR